MMNFVFDVDGTLTDSRAMMNNDFLKWFTKWMIGKNVYLATGSDYAKTLEQLGEHICTNVSAVYNCSGNAVYIGGKLVRHNELLLTTNQMTFLHQLLNSSPFEHRTGNHIESRIGMYNFSVVGRNATQKQRKQYYDYDLQTGERNKFVSLINDEFVDIEATAGGETGIDIYRKGLDKSQIADEVKPFIFFGDKIVPGGNDFFIAQHAENYHNVISWHDTWKILKERY